MPKNGKSKEKNQIEPRQEGNVRFKFNSNVGDANHQLVSNHCVWEKTTASTQNLNFDNNAGIMFGMSESSSDPTGAGYQLHINYHGQVSARKNNGKDRHSPWTRSATESQLNTAKQELNNRISQLTTPDLSQYFKKPEHNELQPRANLDTIKDSGIYHVKNDSTGIPQGVDNTWGILQVFKEGGGVFQLYVTVDGSARGKIFTRTWLNSSWAPWRSLDQAFDSVMNKPIPVPNNRINKTTPTGYYITDQSTQGLPNGISGSDKKGFLKVLKDNDHGILTFTSSTNNKVYTGYYNGTTRTNDLNWNEVNGTEGHTKIHDSRDQEQQAPKIYAQHASSNKGFLVYEWKWARTIRLYQNGGTPPDTTFDPPLKSDESILLKTVVPQGAQLVGDDLVHQIGFAIASHRTFYRKANERAGNTWSKWVEIGVGEHGANISKPENENPIDNANDVAYSGVFRTQSSPLTQGLPATNNTEGFLTHYKKDSNSAIQYWTAIAGDKAGKFFTRTKVGGQWSSHWTELGSGGSTPQPTPQDLTVISSFDKMDESGVFKTSPSVTTSGEKPPQVRSEDRYGIMQIYSENRSQKTGCQIWTCVTGGPNEGRMFRRVIISNQRKPWKEITESGGGSQGINREQVVQIIKEELKRIVDTFHR